MKIAGLQKLTLLDYPGKTAATIFTPGCNFRCPFCHNAELVFGSSDTPSQNIAFLSEEDLFSFFTKRQGLLDGVCITGGEPTLQPDLEQFCQRIKTLGFLVKLDTNGSNPGVVEHLISAGLVDHVALDVKNAPSHYARTVGVRSFATKRIESTMKLLLEGSLPFEFRTTIVREFHPQEALIDLAQWIASLAAQSKKPLEKVPWFLQQFVDSETVLVGQEKLHAWNTHEAEALLPKLQCIVPQASLRGFS